MTKFNIISWIFWKWKKRENEHKYKRIIWNYIYLLMTWCHYKKILKTPLLLLKILDLENKCSNIVGYKANFEKLAAFLYINYEFSRKEVVVTIPFLIASKTLSKKFRQGMEDRHYEKYRTNIITLVQMPILFNMVYRYKTMPIIMSLLFIEIEKYLRFVHMGLWISWISKAI